MNSLETPLFFREVVYIMGAICGPEMLARKAMMGNCVAGQLGQGWEGGLLKVSLSLLSWHDLEREQTKMDC